MSGKLKPGDHVEWNTSQGKTRGEVKKKLTKPTGIKGHHIAASAKHPQYLVESDSAHAAQRAPSLHEIGLHKIEQ